MAMVAYSTFVTDIAPHVDGCPTNVIAMYLRKVFTDLCDRTLCWRTTLDDLALSEGVTSYALVSPIADTEVAIPINVQLISSEDPTKRTTLSLLTYEQAMQRYSDWPNVDNEGRPEAVFQMTPGELCVAPAPDAQFTYTLQTVAAIRPTSAAATVEDAVVNLFKRALFHGTVHELMILPERAWSNDKLAVYHGKQWEFFLNTAKAKANKGYGRSNLSVVMRPWA